MNIEFEKEREYIGRLSDDDELFEREFGNLKDSYPMDNPNKIYNFLKDNPGIIIVLNEVRPLLSQYVPYAKFNLKLDDDPIFVPQLLLVVNAPRNKFGNGFKGNIKKINSSIRPFLLEFNLGAEFFIFDGLLRDNY